ncbi:coiled-coil domain-containing protein 138-like isoform X1 [Hypomesus transpacificus]|uniref:coiled-coil domain-containing protein 138-like isoform X1 n=1 Tax=Hypomesus transpacificus TaxID=137520 RepID=UPI001F08505F|nr:coiled-coil domain-containing protein 138-like isoform X1 [Hypomesus transpacificus]
MSNTSSETDVDFTIEMLKKKYLGRRELLSSDNGTGGTNCHSNEPPTSTVTPSSKVKSPHRGLRGYKTALRELLKAVTLTPMPERLDSDGVMSSSDEDLSMDYKTCPLLDTVVHYTETDVTLPSSLASSLGSRETEPGLGMAREEQERGLREQQPQSYSLLSSTPDMGQVCQEMLVIYQQLRAERESQQQWQRELQERESRLLRKELALSRLRGVEEEVHARILEVQEKHQREVSGLQELLRERTKENRRLKSSFDTIKELNDTMKKQLTELCEHNKRLEGQSRKVQARLENLQRKNDYSLAQRGREHANEKTAETGAAKREKSASSSKTKKGCIGPAPVRLLALLLDWVVDGQSFPPAAGDREAVLDVPLVVSLHERCSKVLPLLVEQLQLTSGSDPSLILPLLRLIYQALRQLDSTTQPVTLCSTLRRLGEEVSRPPALQPSGPPDLSGALRPRGPTRTTPLYRSPCPHTRLLSALIVLRTVTQADVLAQALDSIHGELACEQSRGLFLHHAGLPVLLTLLRGGRGGPHAPVDILLLLASPSRFLSPFLEACSSEDFFRTAALLLRSSRLALPLLEKLSILLQKLSTLRKNKRLFELCSLHLLLQEMLRTTDPTHTFLCLNLNSILLNLK